MDSHKGSPGSSFCGLCEFTLRPLREMDLNATFCLCRTYLVIPNLKSCLPAAMPYQILCNIESWDHGLCYDEI